MKKLIKSRDFSYNIEKPISNSMYMDYVTLSKRLANKVFHFQAYYGKEYVIGYINNKRIFLSYDYYSNKNSTSIINPFSYYKTYYITDIAEFRKILLFTKYFYSLLLKDEYKGQTFYI